MRFHPHNLLACGLLMAASPTLASGQAAADRRFLDSIIGASTRAATETAVPLLTRCDGHDPDVASICQAIIAVYHSPLARRREEVFAAEDIAVRAVFDRDRWPYAWFALGLVRLQLARDKVLPHEGPAEPPGTSAELGGANALVHALELDPTFAAAADALAAAPAPREGPDAMAPRVVILRLVRSLLSPAGSAQAASVERDAGSVDSAVALERRALAAGSVDSGVVFLALARDLYRANHPADGRAALFAGAAATTDASRRAYRGELALVATPQELAEWDSVPPRSRPAWLAGFWSRRDVIEGRPDGSRLIEHYRRVEYAMAHFRIGVPDTDRPRTLTFLRSDEYVPEQQSLDFAARNANLCPEAARFATDARTLGADAPDRYFQPVQDLLDDRGAVWIRHGPPTRSRQANGAEAVEVWRYDRPEGPLVLQFRAAAFPGTTGVSVLVPSLLTVSPGLRNQVCSVEPSICSRLGVSGPIQAGDTILVRPATEVGGWGERIPPIDPMTHRPTRIVPNEGGRKKLSQLTERCVDPIARVLEREVHAEGTLLGTAAITRARDQGRQEIDLATTTDTYRREFSRVIHPSVQIAGLDRATDGVPRVVIAYALPAEELGVVPAESAGKGVRYPVRIQVMLANARTGQRSDIDTLPALVVDAPLGRDRVLTGLLEVPRPSGRYAVGLVFTQPDGRGATVASRDVTVPPATTPALAASDLVLGRENSGVRWSSGTSSVALNPTGHFQRGGNAEVYVQLSGLVPGRTYQTMFEFFRADDDAGRAPRLTITFPQAAAQDRIEVARTLGLRNLDAGRYRMRLTVTGEEARTTATAWLMIDK